MQENLRKFGEVAVFIFLGILFLVTGYVSWGQGTPEIRAWFMPMATLTALGWGVRLLYASMVEVHQICSVSKAQANSIGR